ncbi:MAG: hypothetical protein IJK52_02380 [Oscillospiraceae bacterium]|nr:hypothetical protein [Oscillospiraceae bacterium]
MNHPIKRSFAFVMLLAILFTLTAPAAFAATTNYNVSYSPVTCNASAGSLPSGVATVKTGDKVYFNIQVDSSQKLKTVSLYLKTLGDKSYKQVSSKTAKNYLRYQDFPYQIGSKTGTLSYYFAVVYTNGTKKNLSAKSVTVKNSPPPVPNGVIRYNVSYSPVTSNASAGNLPAEAKPVYAGDKIYFNIQAESSLQLKSVTLFYKLPGAASYQSKTETAKNYLRYTDFPYTLGSATGTLYYYFTVTYTNGAKKTFSAKSVTVSKKAHIVSEAAIKAAAATYGIASGTNAYKALQAINNYDSKLNATQKKGTLVFLFEGVGNNASASKRLNAMCVVVKNGKISYVNRNSSTIPDYPFDPKKNEGTAMPTLKSGVYSFTTVNHRDSYAALNVTAAPVVRFKSKSSYFSDTSYAINAHRRSTDTIPSPSAGWVNSAGCQIIGKSGTGASGEYAKFIKAVGIVGSNANGNSRYTTKVSGKIIVDRSYAAQYLRNVGYSEAAIRLIG